MQPPPSTSSKTRRSFLLFAGFASLGLIPDILYRAVFAHQSSVPNSSQSTSQNLLRRSIPRNFHQVKFALLTLN